MPTVRKATREEIPRLSETLARAFYDDPVTSWLFPDEGKRVGRQRRFFAARMRQLIGQDEVYTTDGLAGGAVWALPDRWRVPPLEVVRLGAVLAPALRRRLPLAVRGLSLIEERHPRPPHYYLALLGTDPERQGEGIGSTLLAPVLDGCDRDEIPAYLESSKERNVAFYARHGFRVTEEVDLPRGPRVWLMWRDPRP